MPPQTPIWQTIHDTLQDDIRRGQYAAGDKLPTEATLAARFGVNRHTIRRALAALSNAGITHARRGAGVFVTHPPTEYPIGPRVRFHQNLEAAGKMPNKTMLAFETRLPNAAEQSALALAPKALVHVYDGLSFADDHPIAAFRSLFPAARLPDMHAALLRSGSVTQAFAEHGIADYTRAQTRLSALPCPPTEARHLRLTPGAPALYSESVNVDADGTPIELGQTWFAGDRVTLTLEP